MNELPILTTELTYQLEQHISPKETPPSQADAPQVVVRFGKTMALRERGAWPPSAVFCFNAGDVGRLNEILAFFGDSAPIFYLVHGGYTPEVGQALTAAGYAMSDWKQTILYGLPAAEAAALPPGVTIELVTPDTIEIAAEVAAQGNEWPEQWREAAKDGVRRSIHQEHYHQFLVRYEGQSAGVGGLSRSGTFEKWCGLGGGAVVPQFRAKGIHTALLRHRLHTAFKLGYELVVGGVFFGTTSFRNQQRVGLRLAYIEAAWKKRK